MSRSTRAAVRNSILTLLAGGVKAAEARFDPKSGRFLAGNGGWAVSAQDIVYPLALLYTTPGTKHYGRKTLRKMALRGGDALCDWQEPDGTFVFIKVDGSRWGKIFMPWPMYHWLETYRLLRGEMDTKRRRRWERGLTIAFDGIAAHLDKVRSTHNIPTWLGMTLIRASQLMDRPDWLKSGRDQIMRTVAWQTPDGYWPEGGGPTTGYNMVYVHAIGLYYHFTGDEHVLQCLERALAFHLHFTYPDGSPVETVDGRQKYHSTVGVTGIPGFALFPAGRGLTKLLIDRMKKQCGKGALSPHLASAWEHFPEGRFEETPQTKKRFVSVHCGHGLVRRSAPWFACLSGYLSGAGAAADNSRNRWIMDRQQYVSVFHDRLGLIVGGGNSKHHPEFCTFEYRKGGAVHFEADSIELKKGHSGDVLTARYGGDRCELRLRMLDAKRVKLTFRVIGKLSRDASVRAGLTLRLKKGDKLRWGTVRKYTTVDPLSTIGFGWDGKDPARKRNVRTDGWRVDMPPDSTFEWPIYPFNPYAIDDAAPEAQAVAAVSVLLKTKGKKERSASFILTVR